MNRTVKILLAVLTVAVIALGIAFRQTGVITLTTTDTTATATTTTMTATTTTTTETTVTTVAATTEMTATAPTTTTTTATTTTTTPAAPTETTTVATIAATTTAATTTAKATTTATTAKPSTATATTTTETQSTCTLTVECLSILDNMAHLKEGHEAYVPKDGYIIKNAVCPLQKGDTVYDILKRTCKAQDVKLTAKSTQYGIYVSGISHLDEFDVGKELGWTSGWTYYVNGEFAKVACSAYEVQEGDKIVFSYSCKAP